MRVIGLALIFKQTFMSAILLKKLLCARLTMSPLGSISALSLESSGEERGLLSRTAAGNRMSPHAFLTRTNIYSPVNLLTEN